MLGLLLFGAALVAVWRNRESLAEAATAAGGAPLWLIGACVALPAANWLLISSALWVLTRRYGEVRSSEMTMLVGSAWLLNYLPMRPGMLGRIAYHKRINGIRVRDSVRVIVVGVALSAAAAGVLLGVAWTAPPGVPGLALLLAPAGAIAALTPAGRLLPGDAWRLAPALALRYLDLLVWTARYLATFSLLGHPLGVGEAAVIAGASQIALLVPITGNGLGLREWAVALTAAATGGDGGIALTADLVNRAAELLVAVPIGLLCAGALARRLRRAEPVQPDPPA